MTSRERSALVIGNMAIGFGLATVVFTGDILGLAAMFFGLGTILRFGSSA